MAAAHEGATGRLRAVLMTAAAMIAGMTPMSLEGTSAPLGRAVIGGLILSTFTTLTVLPAIYAILQRRARTTSPSLNPEDPGSRYYESH
jgi:multidrug efflux pump subunit AcrB